MRAVVVKLTFRDLLARSARAKCLKSVGGATCGRERAGGGQTQDRTFHMITEFCKVTFITSTSLASSSTMLATSVPDDLQTQRLFLVIFKHTHLPCI